MDTDLIIAIAGGLAGIVGGLFGWLKSRDVGVLQVRLANIEARDRTDARDHDQLKSAADSVKALTTAIKTLATSNQSITTYIDNQTEIIRKVARSMDLARENSVKIAALLATHDSDMRGELSTAIEDMRTRVTERDAQLEALPERIKNEMAPELDRILKAIEDALTPKIDQLTASITVLEQRVTDATDQIPAKTSEILCGELNVLRTVVESSLREMLTVAKQIAEGYDQQSDDATPHTPETKPDTKESPNV
jgi:hypothetical protein